MAYATFIRSLNGFTGDARLYRCDPPMNGASEFVIVSGTSVFGSEETYIFPADVDGQITGWGELDGSFQGEINHERALSGAGYTLTATET